MVYSTDIFVSNDYEFLTFSLPDSSADPQASVQPMTPVIQDEAPGGMTANSENVLATNDVNQVYFGS